MVSTAIPAAWASCSIRYSTLGSVSHRLRAVTLRVAGRGLCWASRGRALRSATGHVRGLAEQPLGDRGWVVAVRPSRGALRPFGPLDSLPWGAGSGRTVISRERVKDAKRRSGSLTRSRLPPRSNPRGLSQPPQLPHATPASNTGRPTPAPSWASLGRAWRSATEHLWGLAGGGP